MAFVTPAKDMLIRPGNHVDPSGRCYHPYLANWVNYSDVCMLFIYSFCTMFLLSRRRALTGIEIEYCGLMRCFEGGVW